MQFQFLLSLQYTSHQVYWSAQRTWTQADMLLQAKGFLRNVCPKEPGWVGGWLWCGANEKQSKGVLRASQRDLKQICGHNFSGSRSLIIFLLYPCGLLLLHILKTHKRFEETIHITGKNKCINCSVSSCHWCLTFRREKLDQRH